MTFMGRESECMKMGVFILVNLRKEKKKVLENYIKMEKLLKKEYGLMVNFKVNYKNSIF